MFNGWAVFTCYKYYKYKVYEAKLSVNNLMPCIDKVRALVRETENALSR
ncbi:hypothetical protein [Vulcanisaeta distributa]|nr:hypothetical protein [Vulcanisaeta distributa]